MLKQFVKYRCTKHCNAILITGTGRNGTTYVARAFKELYPEIYVGHEIAPDGLGIQNLNHQQQIQYFVHGRGKIAFESLLLNKRLNGISLIESNCYVAPSIPAYRDSWKNLKTIGIIREWKSCITSMASQSFPEQPHFFYSNNDPNGKLRPTPKFGKHHSQWESMSRLERIAWYWSSTNEALLEQARLFPKETYLIDFQELKSNSQSFLEKLQRFMHLEPRFLEEDVKKSNFQEMNQIRIDLSKIDANELEAIEAIVSPTSKKIEDYFALNQDYR